MQVSDPDLGVHFDEFVRFCIEFDAFLLISSHLHTKLDLHHRMSGTLPGHEVTLLSLRLTSPKAHLVPLPNQLPLLTETYRSTLQESSRTGCQ